MDLKSGYPYRAVKNGLMYAFLRLDADLPAAESYSLARWKSRPLREKFFEKILLPIKSQL